MLNFSLGCIIGSLILFVWTLKDIGGDIQMIRDLLIDIKNNKNEKEGK